MVIEHEFVTTLDSQSALSTAARFLGEGGFSSDGKAFTIGQTEWTTLDMKRGKKNANRAKSISELPQRIIVNYDRGRVTVAASIAASHVWGGAWSLQIGFGISSVTESKKKMVLHQQLLVAVINDLERTLTDGQNSNIARAEWHAAEQAIAQAARKRKRRNLIMVAIAILAVLTLFGAILFTVSR